VFISALSYNDMPIQSMHQWVSTEVMGEMRPSTSLRTIWGICPYPMKSW